MELLEAKLPVRMTSVHPGGVKTAIASSALEAARALGLPVTAKDEARRKNYDEKLLRMPPPQAAEIILNGVARNRGRVLVGNDARIMDAFVRLSPVGYQQFLLLLSRRMT
jgi:hypothetical protein